jgi:DNA-binding transcriptional regulator YiaG
MSGGYKDPKTETLASGRSVADVIGARGGKGMPGLIVAPARIDGRSTAFDPHDPGSIQINIEPDNPNSAKLSLAQFTKAAVNQALATAHEKIPGSDIKDIRERTAVAFEELSKFNNSGVQRVNSAGSRQPPKPQPAQEADDAHEETMRTIAALADDTAALGPYQQPEAVDRAYSPMAAFGLKKQSSAAHRTAPVNKSAEAGPPKKLVYFEKEGIGTVPAFFHDVIIEVDIGEDGITETGFIVLIYDLRFEQAAARWFPPADDPYKRPWAVQINNDRRLYLVHTTGFQYVYDSREFCVLAVEKAVTAE